MSAHRPSGNLLLLEPLLRSLIQFPEECADLFLGSPSFIRVQTHHARHREVRLGFRGQDSQGTKKSRSIGNEHLANVQLLGNLGRMHRTGAAIGHERIVARIETLLGADQTNLLGDCRVDDFDDAGRGLLASSTELFPQSLHGRMPLVAVDAKAVAQDGAGDNPSQDEMRVGDRSLAPAPAVAGGAGIGADAPWADLEQSARVPPRDAPSPGPDGPDVQGCPLHWKGVDVPVAHDGRCFSVEDAYVGAGPPDIECDDLLFAGQAGHEGRAGDPRGGPRSNQGHGLPFGRFTGHDSAVALHYHQRNFDAELRRSRFKM